MLHKSLSCETQLLISLSFKLSPLGNTSIPRQSIAANNAISFNIELHNKPSWDPLHAQTVHWTVEANRQPNVTGISNSNCMYPTVKQSTTARQTMTCMDPTVKQSTTARQTITCMDPTVKQSTTARQTITCMDPTVKQSTTARQTITCMDPTVKQSTTARQTITCMDPTVKQSTTARQTITCMYPTVKQSTTARQTITCMDPTVKQSTTVRQTITCMDPTVKQSTTASCSVQSLHSDVVELRLWLVPTITHTLWHTGQWLLLKGGVAWGSCFWHHLCQAISLIAIYVTVPSSACQWYFSFKIHVLFSFYKFFCQSFLFLYYISIDLNNYFSFHKLLYQSFLFYNISVLPETIISVSSSHVRALCSNWHLEDTDMISFMHTTAYICLPHHVKIWLMPATHGQEIVPETCTRNLHEIFDTSSSHFLAQQPTGQSRCTVSATCWTVSVLEQSCAVLNCVQETCTRKKHLQDWWTHVQVSCTWQLAQVSGKVSWVYVSGITSVNRFLPKFCPKVTHLPLLFFDLNAGDFYDKLWPNG